MFAAGKGIEMDMSLYFPPVLMYQIWMEPGAVISLLDHCHYNGVLVVREGDVRVRNFDLVDADGKSIRINDESSDSKTGDVLIREFKEQKLQEKQVHAHSRPRQHSSRRSRRERLPAARLLHSLPPRSSLV